LYNRPRDNGFGNDRDHNSHIERGRSGMTITIELPEELAARLEGLTEEERDRYTLAALTAGMGVWTPEEEAQDHADMVVAVNEALDEVDAGRDMPLEELVAEREAFWKAR
jgi:predicted transcriptional regulator